MEDITYRAVRILKETTVLACEDTRQTRKILERYGIEPPATILSYHEHNEETGGKRILGFLKDGVSVALCTDAGMPGVSDPGYRVIQEACAQGFTVDVIPGASAVTTALAASGLSSASFTFKGFPPRKEGARRRFLEAEKDLPHTLIFFESPFRVGSLLASALEVFGNRKAAVCTELTKKFGSVTRGFLKDLAPRYESAKIKGEVTVVIAGNNPKFADNQEQGDNGDDAADLPDENCDALDD
jgi:16S rRNA (cytidine1402-2'-O)-methyltransferase